MVCGEQQTFIYKVHNHDTRSTNNFHLPITNLTKYLEDAHYAGIKIFNQLSTHKKCVLNEIQVFKSALKRFLLSNLFYSIGEYFNSTNNIYSRLLCFNVLICILLCNHCIIIVFCNITAVIQQTYCVITL